MRTLILALLCLTGISPNAPQGVSWKDFTSTEGKFTVSLPDEPRTNIFVTDTREGTLYTHTVSSTDKDLNEYMVGWTEHREERTEGPATEKTFGHVRDGLLVALEGKLVSESSDQLEGYPARTITLTASDGRLIKARFSFVRNRFYEVMAQIRAGDKESADRFLTSFKLIKN